MLMGSSFIRKKKTSILSSIETFKVLHDLSCAIRLKFIQKNDLQCQEFDSHKPGRDVSHFEKGTAKLMRSADNGQLKYKASKLVQIIMHSKVVDSNTFQPRI
ncbi:hypothetical protein TNIN_262551 [Trichonephila inaurata madagascariensis]|uniref:Uncharacterized protein n=1 Tax=Trichonephila inaurata madagascariensis TaxID=2747483 RepID=A0A8X6XZ13_9ARAC|nr:hypothetical protein TNIN_262551 [Trichonephila inaurata madagascariensis]